MTPVEMNRDAVHRAISYPYEIPNRSYVVTGKGYEELSAGTPAPDVSGRRPVLAVGSNQSPEQLIRKFGDTDLGPIIVVRAGLADFDIVYSPHLSAYGAVPATLRHSPGTRVTVFVNWLTPEQEARMHETETSSGNYDFGRLDNIGLTPETGPALTSAFVYSSRRGSLARGGLPVPLSAIGAENRQWPAMSQHEIQTYVRDRLSPGQTIEDFVLASISDAAIRLGRTETLMIDSLPLNFPDFAPVTV